MKEHLTTHELETLHQLHQCKNTFFLLKNMNLEMFLGQTSMIDELIKKQIGGFDAQIKRSKRSKRMKKQKRNIKRSVKNRNVEQKRY